MYSFEPLPEPVLSCNGSKVYISMYDCDGHSSVDLPSKELLEFLMTAYVSASLFLTFFTDKDLG